MDGSVEKSLEVRREDAKGQGPEKPHLNRKWVLGKRARFKMKKHHEKN